jgi:hypothetical protein
MSAPSFSNYCAEASERAPKWPKKFHRWTSARLYTMSDSEASATNTPKKSKSSDKYSEKVKYCAIIAQPLASRKSTKHVLKLVKKGKLLFVSAFVGPARLVAAQREIFWIAEQLRNPVSPYAIIILLNFHYFRSIKRKTDQTRC